MSRFSPIGRVALAAIVACGVGAPATCGPAAAARIGARGAAHAPAHLTVQVWLRPDLAGAARFATAVSTPHSSSYHRYLSPDGYTRRFGARRSEASPVSAWLHSRGLSGVHVSSQRDYVSATGTPALVDRTFHVRMTHAPSGAGNPVVPARLTHDVLSVTGVTGFGAGIDTKAPSRGDMSTDPSPSGPQCSQYWGQNQAPVSPPFDGATSIPTSVCGYSADQMRDAYDLTAADTGRGQTVALIEVGTPTEGFRSLTDYASSNGLPAPQHGQFTEEQIGDSNACGNNSFSEEQLDSEAVYAMAPAADQIMVDGNSCLLEHDGFEAFFDAQEVVLDGNGEQPQAHIISNSWGFGTETGMDGDALTAHAIDLRAAAEGVGMYDASGDAPDVQGPASDPDATAVGGTTLGIGAQGNVLFQTGWSDLQSHVVDGRRTNAGIISAGGGGRSTLYTQPAYQTGVVPASMSTAPGSRTPHRTVPDIAADADDDTGFLIGYIAPARHGGASPYMTEKTGGTSLATPLVAGMVADAQEGQSTAFGFINPLLYSLHDTAAIDDVLPQSPTATPLQDETDWVLDNGSDPTRSIDVFDDQGKGTAQVTAPGYDTMTGLGTPNGTAFIDGLRSGTVATEPPAARSR